MNFDHVRPLIVPAEYVRAGVPAAYASLAAPDLALAWVELTPRATMHYVTPSQAAEWDGTHPAWRENALDAMRRADHDRFWTHEKRTDTGALAWIGMMQEDGLGSSRLLLAAELARTFPEGYLVAFPDRSCGMAISRTHADLEQVRAMVAKMHEGATIPMIPDVREPAALRVVP